MTTSSPDEINAVKDLIIESLRRVMQFDMNLFENPMGRTREDQKLYEVCINHRLAVYIECHLKSCGYEYYVDIEYNKNNYRPKKLMINGNEEEVRPDIIVHTRIENHDNLDKNYLIIELKKGG